MTVACRDCGENRTAEMVRNRRKPGGLESLCRACNRERTNKHRAADPAGYRERVRLAAIRYRQRKSTRSEAELRSDAARLNPTGTKRCRAGHYAPLSAFYINRSMPDGLTPECKAHGTTWSDHAQRWELEGVAKRCYVCGGIATQVEHVVPRALGGSDDWTLPSCAPCNFSKHATPLDVWLATRDNVVPSPELTYALELTRAYLYGEAITPRTPAMQRAEANA